MPPLSDFGMVFRVVLEHRHQLLKLQLPHLNLLFSDRLLQTEVQHPEPNQYDPNHKENSGKQAKSIWGPFGPWYAIHIDPKEAGDDGEDQATTAKNAQVVSNAETFILNNRGRKWKEFQRCQ